MNDFRQINKHESKLVQARRKAPWFFKRGQGRFCPCCCRGTEKDEARLVRRGRRRLDRAIIDQEVEAWMLSGST